MNFSIQHRLRPVVALQEGQKGEVRSDGLFVGKQATLIRKKPLTSPRWFRKRERRAGGGGGSGGGRGRVQDSFMKELVISGGQSQNWV